MTFIRSVSCLLFAFTGFLVIHAPVALAQEATAESPYLSGFSDPPTAADFLLRSPLPESVVPIGGTFDAKSDCQLARALAVFSRSGSSGDTSALEQFLATCPTSPYAASVALNLGLVHHHQGWFKLALREWRMAWVMCTGTANDPAAKLLFGTPAQVSSTPYSDIIAARAMAEMMQVNMWVGRKDVLDALFAELGNRPVTGIAESKIQATREGRQLMQGAPGVSFKCGPYALDMLLNLGKPTRELNPIIEAFKTTEQGTSLADLEQLSAALGMPMQAVKRVDPRAPLIVPAVIHWELGHFSALLADNGETVSLSDRTLDGFGGDSWHFKRAAFVSEWSGYALVKVGPLVAGWEKVSLENQKNVHGRGPTGTKRPPGAQSPFDPAVGDCGCAKGMMRSSFHILNAAVTLRDTPLFYTPPVGPEIAFTFTYNEKADTQPNPFPFSNVGQKWSFNWGDWMDEPTAQMQVHLGSGGTLPLANSSGNSWTSAIDGSITVFDPALIGYTCTYLDGSRKIYGKTANSVVGASPNRKFLISSETNAQGISLVYAYDIYSRLTSIIDGSGKTTNLYYEIPFYSTLVSRIVDPYNRTCSVAYESGRLSSITDAVGMVSSVTYEISSDVVASMTTPYGTTVFKRGSDSGTASTAKNWVEAYDPNGDVTRIEYIQGVTPSPEPTTSLPLSPPGLPWELGYDQWRNVFYWDKKAMKRAYFNSDGTASASRYNSAVCYHFLHGQNSAFSTTQAQFETGRMLESVKYPNAARIRYAYPGQTRSSYDSNVTLGTPSWIATVVEDATGNPISQVTKNTFDTSGRLLTSTDPANRVTRYTYSAAGDLSKVELQTSAGVFSTLTNVLYNAQHLPTQVTDAAGQVTSASYNAIGQILTTTAPQSTGTGTDVTTFTYTGQRLTGVTMPVVPGDVAKSVSIAYDAVDRPMTVTGIDGTVTTTAYDNLDRPTKITYQDNSSVDVVWNKLDATQISDRTGRITRRAFTALGQLASVTDPAGRRTLFDWCKCGRLQTLTDASGNVTNWNYDQHGRLTSKVFADTTQEVYDYFPISGRLRSVTDALNRVKTLKYTIDGRMAAVAYSGGTVATPGVTFNYDTFYPRLTSLVDGTGTTAYQYIPLGSLGAGAVQKITTGMFAGSADFVYDRRGAMVQRSIGTGVGASTVGMTYDNWGRATSLNNDLGTFSFIYSSALSRLQQITYPTATGMSTVFNFARDATQDVRLASMTHRTGGGTPVMASSNTYGYDQSGNIQTWQQAAVATTTKQANFGYDLVDQVVSANKDGDPAAEMWTYDAVGNRRTSQSGNEVTGYSTNAVNQSLTSGVSTQGTTSLVGHTDEPARVTVNGQAVPTDSGNRFRAVVPLNQDVPIVAVDGRGNTRLRTIRIASTGPGSRTFTYDAVGNLTADGLRTYTWDAENRLVSITQGTKRSEFTYDGMSRRVRIIEKDNSVVQSNKTYLWVGAEMAEERDATGATVTKRYFSQGISIGGVKHYYCKDHLGSVREVRDATGALEARYDYSTFGVRTRTSGTFDAEIGYTGHWHHQSGVVMTWFRGYDPTTGRWLSRDPIEPEKWYTYGGNNPINRIDLVGGPDGSWDEYWGSVGDMYLGYGDAAVGLASGVAGVAMHPIDTVSGLANAAMHPIDTLNAVASDIECKSGSDRGRGQLVGDILLTVAGVGVAQKVGMAAKAGRMGGLVNSVGWADASGILRAASRTGIGNSGIGSANMATAMAAGAAWVGDGYTISSKGIAWVSKDGLRQFRPPAMKPRQGFCQANFESRAPGSKTWSGNAHLDVTP